MESKALECVEPLLPLGLKTALRVARAAWRQLSVEERALITADWHFWFREKQFPPPGAWRSWGFLTGRGLGKTTSLSDYVNKEVEAGRAMRVGLCAQDEQSSKDIQIHGPNGLIATAPPWFKPTWEATDLQLVWPNGARAYVRTPEVPGKIRGLDYHLFWASELQSWPASSREEAWSNVELSTRLGLARVLWDATPKKRHPIIKGRLQDALDVPTKHIVVRGATKENAANLGDDYYSELKRKYAGTQKGREELEGEMLEDSECATAKQAWIDSARRPMPAFFARRVISIDPAVSNRRGSDTTGLVEAGLGGDGQGYVLSDESGKMDAGVWGTKTLDRYVRNGCDLILAERNKGGDLVVQNLRALAKERGLEVIVVGKEERPIRVAGKVFVKEVYARGSKDERAEPVGTAYERRRISHVVGADLSQLEDTLTTWESIPGADSPGDLDALVHAMVELLDLSNNVADPKIAFQGFAEAAAQLSAPARTVVQPGTATNLSLFYPTDTIGDRI